MGHSTYNPALFTNWGSLPHTVGTDATGNVLVAQTTGSVRNGDWTQTISKYNPAHTQLLDTSSTRTTAIDDGGGNTRGWQLSNAYADGTSYVAVVDAAGHLLKSTEYTADNRTIVNQAGIRIETNNTTGVKTAFVDGATNTGVPVQPDGSFVVQTSSGAITIQLNVDPLAGGAVTSGGQTFLFTGGETLSVQGNGIGIGGVANGAGVVTDRLIEATGSGTEFIYEPIKSYVDPMGGIYGPLTEGSAPELDFTLTETRAIGANSTGPTTNTATLFTSTTGTAAGETITDATALFSGQGQAAGDANWSLLLAENTVNSDSSYYGGVVSDASTGGYRPGNNNTSGTGAQTSNVTQSATELIATIAAAAGAGGQSGNNVLPDIAYAGANLTNTGTNTPLVPADPLVLDLNGDGIQLQSYANSKTWFDIDNDGAGAGGQPTKEHTGWIAANTTTGQAINTDGILVHDLNGDGVINGIKETLSEYYNGNAGTGQTAGQKTFANGFAALKSLDSNGDNQFTSSDTAWNSLRVWVDDNADGISYKDTNANGIKDATEASELKTLTELGITSINLATTTQSGLVNGGNEVLATGTFTKSGVTSAAQAVRFIANPNGASYLQTTTNGVAGATLTTQGNAGTADVKSYISGNTSSVVNETLSATTLAVSNLYGGAGADTLTGDGNANWLAGGAGSDTFNAGAGDDVLLIDSADQQQNIHAGAGNDVVQVVGGQLGSAGVTLNMAQAEAEVFIGGDGDDVIIAGGRSTVFIRGGAGDDLIIGGAANDVLSGEDGSDLIDGGAGNDLIRGHRGQDQLLGGAGDDVLDGGLEDDTLSGGAGNDVLIGGRGDDTLDGGDGIDVAEFSGSYADYRITKVSNANGGNTFRVVDTRTGQDGADTLTNIEKLSFSDVSRVDLSLAAPLPVQDILSVNSTGQALSRTAAHLLSKTQLLSNDRDWDSDTSQLSITAVLEAKGGTATLTAQGDVLFTPDATYTGVMSFKYKVQDAQGNFTQATNTTTGQTETMKAAVYLQTSDLPTDPLAMEQWYLTDTNVIAAWGTAAEQAAGQGYSGKGVKMGQFEPGSPFSTGPEVFDYRHPDLAQNADKAWLNTLDAQGNSNVAQTFSNHATMVAGVMVAARNGQGGVGVAYNASLAGQYIQGTGLEISQLSAEITSVLAKFKNYDVVNNSWGATSNFQINVVPTGTLETGILDAVTNGRGGLVPLLN